MDTNKGLDLSECWEEGPACICMSWVSETVHELLYQRQGGHWPTLLLEELECFTQVQVSVKKLSCGLLLRPTATKPPSTPPNGTPDEGLVVTPLRLLEAFPGGAVCIATSWEARPDPVCGPIQSVEPPRRHPLSNLHKPWGLQMQLLGCC